MIRRAWPPFQQPEPLSIKLHTSLNIMALSLLHNYNSGRHQATGEDGAGPQHSVEVSDVYSYKRVTARVGGMCE
jgi:hypothetical protein